MDRATVAGAFRALWVGLASASTVAVVAAATVTVCERAARPDPLCGAADRARLLAAEVDYLRSALDRSESERLAVRAELDQLRRGAMLWPVGRSGGRPGECPDDLIPAKNLPVSPAPK